MIYMKSFITSLSIKRLSIILKGFFLILISFAASSSKPTPFMEKNQEESTPQESEVFLQNTASSNAIELTPHQNLTAANYVPRDSFTSPTLTATAADPSSASGPPSQKTSTNTPSLPTSYDRSAQKRANLSSSFINHPVVAKGLYAGEMTGYSSGVSDQTLTQRDVLAQRKTSLRGFSLGGFIGYGISFGFLYAGAEYGYQFLNASSRMSAVNRGYFTPTEGNPSIKLGFLGSHSAVLRAGLYLSEETLLYIKAGHVTSQFENSNALGGSTGFLSYPNSFKKSLKGIIAGVGLESALSENLALRLEVYHTNHAKLSTGQGKIPRTNTLASGKYNLSIIHGGVGFLYRLSPEKKLLKPLSETKMPWGLYVGANAGLKSFVEDVHATGPRYAPLHIVYSDRPLKNLAFGGHAGFSIRLSRLVTAIEGIYFPYKSKISMSPTVGTQGNIYTSAFTDELKGSFQTSLRVGWLLNDSTLLYGRVGHTMSKFTHKGNSDPHASPDFGASRVIVLSGNMKKNLHGYVIGAGIEVFIFGGLSGRIELFHEKYKSFGISNLNSTNRDRVPSYQVMKPEVNAVLFGLSYTI